MYNKPINKATAWPDTNSLAGGSFFANYSQQVSAGYSGRYTSKGIL